MEQQTYFLRLYDTAFPVSQEQYQDYYREQNRWRYLQKLDSKYRLTYYHALDTDEYTGEEILDDGSPSVADVVERKFLLEQLMQCMNQLSPEEKMLLQELYLKGRTIREVSQKLGISLATVHYRKEKVLSKLKTLLEGSLESNKVA